MIKYTRHTWSVEIYSFLKQDEQLDGSLKQDSSRFDINYFKDNITDRYSGQEFDYSINDTGGVNLMQQILSKFFRWLQDVFGIDIEFVDYKTLEYIIYGLLALVVLYVIIKFLINNPVNAVFKTENKPIDNFDYSEEHIEKIDFDNLITKAIEEQNFRLATRFLYLKSLKELSNQKLIEWHFDKTNSDYLNELKNANIKSYFKRISHIYDYIWYGEFPIDEASFKKNESDFLNLIKSASNG